MAFNRCGDRYLAIGCWKQSKRYQWALAAAARFAGEAVSGHGRLQKRERAVIHGNIKKLAFACLLCSVYCGEQTKGHQRARIDVGNSHAPLIARGLNQPARTLAYRIKRRPIGVGAFAGARVAVAAHSAINDFWIAL